MIDETKEIIMDPRQARMWKAYINPKSDTFSNAYHSALKAGYAECSANNITNYEWFKTKKRRLGLLSKAERVIEKTLDMDTLDEQGKEQADLLRVQNDSAKFIAKTLGKEEGYTERTEMTGKNGQGIVFMPLEFMEKYNLKQEQENGEQKLDSESDAE